MADNGLDSSNPITPLQSATIVNALKAMAPQVLQLVAMLTGKALDVVEVDKVIDAGGGIVVSCITIYYTYKSIRSRIDATQTIATKGQTP